jgi:uncharacterized membrane protein
VPGALGGRAVLLYATALAGVVDVLGNPASTRPLVGPAVTLAGFWLLAGAPITLWTGFARRLTSGLDSALLVAVGLAIVTDFVILLAVNFLPLPFGLGDPLTRVPLACGFAVGNILLGAFSPESEPLPRWRPGRDSVPAGLVPIGALSALCVLLAIAGATRLNNGFGPQVSMVAYIAVAALIVVLIIKRDDYALGVIELGIFAAAAAVLLLVSLRGWLITGHDVQTEYEYFRLNYGGQRWEISVYHSAYNACLSITLLPVAFVQMTSVSGIGFFKLVLPVLFALAPIALFRATHNVASRLVALVSVVLFMAFPAFLTDMPYLGRQEVAFVLLGAALVLATDPRRNFRARRVVFVVLLGGVVMAHYSTSYVLLIVLGAAVGFDLCWRLADRVRKRPREDSPALYFVKPWIVGVAAVLALTWAGPVTHTSGQLSSTLTAALQELQGHGNDLGSSATSSSLFGGTQVSDAQRLAYYRDQTVTDTAEARAEGVFLPLSLVDQYQTPVVAVPDMPLTRAGQHLQSVGVPVATVNGVLRSAIAAGLQLLIVLGLCITVFARRKEKRAFIPSRDQLLLAVGALGMLGLLTVVPQFSVDYGLLRAFQQGIYFFGPFEAAGLIWLLRWCRSATVPVLCAALAGIFLDLSGVVPQSTGGYPAQLALNNSGQYYDLYYPTPQEMTAAAWLQAKMVSALTAEPHQTAEVNPFTYGEIQSVYIGPAIGDIFPTMISPTDYVFLGPPEVYKGQDNVIYRGGIVTYTYPEKLLDVKDEIYAGDGVEVYR